MNANQRTVLKEVSQKEVSQKVTLYLSPELHRRLKIQAAIEAESMSALAERAVAFYLEHPEVIEADACGQTHRVYSCPACTTPVVLRNGDMVTLSSQVGNHSMILSEEDDLSVNATTVAAATIASNGIGTSVAPLNAVSDESQRESEQLVPC